MDHNITIAVYFGIASVMAGYFAQVVTKAKMTNKINKFHSKFFKIALYINFVVIIISFLSWALHERGVINTLPGGGWHILILSNLLVYPLGSFSRYFDSNQQTETKKQL